MQNIIFAALLMLLVITPVSAFPTFRSADGPSVGGGYDGEKGGSLIAEIPGPPGWNKVFAVAYHDDHDMLYVARGSSNPNDEVAYGSYSGGETVTWTVFDYVEFVSGLGCYQDDLLFAITQSDPLNPVPYYLYTWNLDASGIPMLPPDVYELGAPFTGAMGGCEWDGEYLWIVDQNFEVDANAIIYKYNVDTHSVVSSWSYSELGAFGIACVWDAGDLRIWISDWFGGYKLMEHSETGTPTGVSYSIPTSPNDIAYKYDVNFDGPGFFVGNYDANTVDFYDHCLTGLESCTWGFIKADFAE